MNEKLGNLQAHRGIAALMVVLFHAAIIESQLELADYPLMPFRWLGSGGVELFFTLSGFIIMYVHRDWFGKPAQVPMFLVRRMWRIYPAYWAAFALCLAWYYFHAGSSPFAADRLESFGRALVLLPQGKPHPWVPQAWTLVHELAFYGTFAVLLLVPRRIAGLALGVWFVFVLARNYTGMDPVSNRFTKLWAGPCVIEFLLGAAVGGFLRPQWGRYASLMLIVAGVWFASAVAVMYEPLYWQKIPMESRAILWAVPSALLIASFASADLTKRFGLPRWLQTIGEASYSIYLIHLLTQPMISSAWHDWHLGHRGIKHYLWIAALVSGAIAGGWLLYVCVERPCLNAMKRWLKKDSKRKLESISPSIQRRAA